MVDIPGALLAHRYRLVEQLGRGGMGVVWRARDEVFGRDVAVKEVLLPPHLTSSERETVVQRTRREARVAARLSHPNVVMVYDVVESDGRPWIVMEMVRAKSLTEVVEENGPLPPARVAAIGLQVLSALTAAHHAGITHRDVKPGNVLCSDSGRVVLTDFGIASVADDPSATMNGILMGSPAYIAPERVRGAPARAASDLWSLGATMYAAVEGRPPYDRGAAVPTVTAVVNEEPDPRKLAGPLGPILDQIFIKDPDARLDGATLRTLLREVASAPEGGVDPAAAVMAKAEATTEPATAASIEAGPDKPSKPGPKKAREAGLKAKPKSGAVGIKLPAQRRRLPLVIAALAVSFLLIGGSALQNLAGQRDRQADAQTEDVLQPSPEPSASQASPSADPTSAKPSTSPSSVQLLNPRDGEPQRPVQVRPAPAPGPMTGRPSQSTQPTP